MRCRNRLDRSIFFPTASQYSSFYRQSVLLMQRRPVPVPTTSSMISRFRMLRTREDGLLSLQDNHAVIAHNLNDLLPGYI